MTREHNPYNAAHPGPVPASQLTVAERLADLEARRAMAYLRMAMSGKVYLFFGMCAFWAAVFGALTTVPNPALWGPAAPYLHALPLAIAGGAALGFLLPGAYAWRRARRELRVAGLSLKLATKIRFAARAFQSKIILRPPEERAAESAERKQRVRRMFLSPSVILSMAGFLFGFLGLRIAGPSSWWFDMVFGPSLGLVVYVAAMAAGAAGMATSQTVARPVAMGMWGRYYDEKAQALRAAPVVRVDEPTPPQQP